VELAGAETAAIMIERDRCSGAMLTPARTIWKLVTGGIPDGSDGI
jgi:hypothetical protein